MEIWGRRRDLGYVYQYRNRQRRILDLVKAALPTGGRILDVAAAQGNFSLLLAEAGYSVVWNDLREELIDYVKLKHTFGDITFAPGDAFALGWNEEFDAVLITEIIEHVAHPDEFLMKVAKMVKPGGYVIMSTPNGAYCRNALPRFSECPDPRRYEAKQFRPNADGHIFLLWPDEVVRLAQQTGLQLEEHVLFTSPLTAGHLGLRYVLPFVPESLVNASEMLLHALPGPLKQKLSFASATRLHRPAN
jgi:2-polyprenyl-6-hydroxyphenyl methylase/3-demethylubiquinone-9 3-methyltransferase